MLAGAIALGEASEDERREYREHVATCPQCLNALGGECEIERVAVTVATARESEIWQPELRDVVSARAQQHRRSLRYGFGVASLALVLSLGVHALVAGRLVPLSATAPQTLAVNADVPAERVSLEQRAVQQPKALAIVPQRRFILQHNIVLIARAPLAAPPAIAAHPTEQAKRADIVAETVHAPPQGSASSEQSNVPVWRRNEADAWRTVATTTTTSLSESAPQTLTHRAESLRVFAQHLTREATPIGGETAINPQPPMIAYDEGAEGTSAFEVLIDDRGNPTKCIITKHAGYTVLDDAVCKAAMQTRYSPKTVDGRAVPGLYRDAFTFRLTNDTLEGVPKQIQ